jgi:hypothetical protein
MSAHNPLDLSAARLWALATQFNRWPVRAGGRALGGSLPVGAIIAGIFDLPDAMPGSSDRLIDLGVIGASTLVLVLMLRWFGQERGILFGLRLTAISWLFLQALELTAYTAWIAAGMDDAPTDWAFVAFSAVLSVGIFIPTAMALRRLDPDF